MESHCRDTVQRYGFNCAMSLMIADCVGGVWFLSPDGAGFDLTAPERSCAVADFEMLEWGYGHDPSFSPGVISVTVWEREDKAPSVRSEESEKHYWSGGRSASKPT